MRMYIFVCVCGGVKFMKENKNFKFNRYWLKLKSKEIDIGTLFKEIKVNVNVIG